jgi:internalin A
VAPILRNQAFISYSHEDKQWLAEFETHLRPFVRNESITTWSDQQIKPGSMWFDEIKAAVDRARVAVMLVTPHFVASEFIQKHELGAFLKLAQSDEVKILWIPVRASAYDETQLKNYQSLIIPPNRPLALLPKAKRDGEWIKVCKVIKAALE